MRDLGEKWPKIVKKCTVLDGLMSFGPEFGCEFGQEFVQSQVWTLLTGHWSLQV